jgi:BirA family transcriptional regulator, biotin operon repressor / biotin---[acetyl-CoA-carboxylase] ligase
VTLGRPRLHLRVTDSTNERARELAAAGAPHGTLVTAGEQSAGRGRQGRAWLAPPGSALLCSVVLREHDPLLTLRAGLAVCDVARGTVKWPNDVWHDGRKVAGILAEGRPQEGWVVLGIGINVAPVDFPIELRETATTLGRPASEVESVLAELLAALEARLAEPAERTLAALRSRDALRGRPVRWADGEGVAAGIADGGGLRVRLPGGEETVLAAGEVHLLAGP